MEVGANSCWDLRLTCKQGAAQTVILTFFFGALVNLEDWAPVLTGQEMSDESVEDKAAALEQITNSLSRDIRDASPLAQQVRLQGSKSDWVTFLARGLREFIS